MKEDIVKKGYEQAEQELKEKQISEVKEIVKRTLERLAEVDKDIDKLQERKKYLKLDLEDLKEGRLDRIEERQEKDPKAKNYSLVIIIKEKVIERITSPWYVPYHVTWVDTNLPGITWQQPTVYCGTTVDNGSAVTYSTSCGSASFGCDCDNFVGFSQPINGSVARDFAPGTYQVGDKIVHLR